MKPELDSLDTIRVLEDAYLSLVKMGVKSLPGLESDLRMRKFIASMNQAIYAPRYQHDPFAAMSMDDIMKMYNLPEKIGPKE